MTMTTAGEEKKDDDASATKTTTTTMMIRKCLSADDVSARTTGKKARKNSDDAGSAYSAASDWMRASFFPAVVADPSPRDGAPDLAETDDSSVGSSSSAGTGPYFEPSDFIPSNWENASDYIPPLGFAVVAGGIACFHPLVFLAGVLTAVGTLKAAGMTYDLCSSDACSAPATFCYGFLPTAAAADEDEDGANPKDEGEAKHGDKLPSQITVSEDSIFQANDATSAATMPAVAFVAAEDGKGLPEADLATMGTDEALQWVEKHYPPLPNKTLDRVEFHGLNALEFFDVFFGDDAPFGFETFHKIRRDKEVQYGPWEELESVRTPCLLSHAPTIPAPVCPPPVQDRAVEYQARTNSFLGPPFAKTNKVQRALKASKRLLVLEMKTTLQDIPFASRFYIVERWVVTAETHPEAADGVGASAPGGGQGAGHPRRNGHLSHHNHGHRFHGKKTSGAANSSPFRGGRDHPHRYAGGVPKMSCAYLTATFQVVFTQACPFEAAVMRESARTISEICAQWNKMAQEGLKRTEETRRVRLELRGRGEGGDPVEVPPLPPGYGDAATGTNAEDEADESVEVTSVGRRRSWVAGEAFPKGEEEDTLGSPVPPLSSLSSSSSRKGKTARQLTRSLSNLVARRRQRTSSTSSPSPKAAALAGGTATSQDGPSTFLGREQQSSENAPVVIGAGPKQDGSNRRYFDL